MSDDKEFSWLSDDHDEEPDQQNDDDLSNLDWLNADDEASATYDETRLGVTGELSWMQSRASGMGSDAGDDDDDMLPDWLDDADDDAPAPGFDASDDEQADWDEDVVDEPDAADEVVLPDWLSDIDLNAVGSAAADSPIDDDFDMPQAAGEPEAADDDWLADIVDDGAGSSSVFDVFEPDEWTPEDEEADFADEEADDEVPIWLRTSEVERMTFDDIPDEPAAASDIPEWLKTGPVPQANIDDMLAEPDDAEASDDDDDRLPDWLTGGASITEPASMFDEAGESDTTGDDWLADLETPEDEQAEPDFVDFDSGEEGEEDEEEFLPDWMLNSKIAPPPGVLDDLPSESDDMLSGGDEAAAQPDFADLMPAAEDMPDLDALLSGADTGDFDLLGELSSGAADLDALLGDADTGDFDLLGELSGGDMAQPAAMIPQEQPADETDDDFEAFDDGLTELDLIEARFDDGQALPEFELDMADFDAPVPAEADFLDELDEFAEFDALEMAGSTRQGVDIDDEALAQLFGDDTDLPDDLADADALFGEFDDAVERGDLPGLADDEAAVPAEVDFLDELDEFAEFGALEMAAPAGQGVDEEDDYDLDDFLATLDSPVELPKTGELSLEDDFSFDELFADNELEAIEEPVSRRSDLPALSPDAPEWLTDLSQSLTDDSSAAALIRQQMDRPLDELPDRLKQLRERGFEISTDVAQPGNTGQLSSVLPGVHNTLPVANFRDVEDIARSLDLDLTEEQRDRAELLQTLAGRSVELGVPTGEDDAAGAQKRARSGRLGGIISARVVISLLLVVMMVLPFLMDAFHIGDLPPTQFAAGTHQIAFVEAVNQVQPGELVLIAAEYGPTGAAELDDATQSLLLHLLARGARPVVVGGNPAGLLHVEYILRDIADLNGLVANRDYYVTRYLVGDVVGLRAFSENIGRQVRTSVQGEDTGLNVETLDDFALIVLMVERTDRLRSWAEQVSPLTTTPLIAITGFSASPLARPYLDAETINGLLIGFEDAYTYRQMVDEVLEFAVLPDMPPASVETDVPAVQPTIVQPTDEVPAVEVTEQVQETATPEPPTNTPESPTAAPTSTPEPPTNTPELLTPTETPEPPTNTPEPPTATPTTTPTATNTPEPVIFAVITADTRVNIRSGPSTSTAPVDTLGPGDRALVIGENEDASWYNILLENGTEGWIAAFLVELDIIPAEEAPPQPEQPEDESEESSANDDASTRWQNRHALAKQPDPPVPVGTPGSEGAPPINILATIQAQVQPGVAPGQPTLTSVPVEGGDTPQDAQSAQVEPTAPVQNIPAAQREIVVPEERGDRDERWYSMTVGIMIVVMVIALGNILNILRSLTQKRGG